MADLGSLSREPLLHFVLLALLIFLLWGLRPAEPGKHSIVLSEARIAALEARFGALHGRAPDAAEREGLLAAEIEEELLFREGKTLGLDRGDPIVRRRVVQKMRFLLEEGSEVSEPTAEELERWMEDRPERYAREQEFAITQAFISGDESDDPELDARALLEELRGGGDPAGRGHPFAHGQIFSYRSLADYASLFGASFARELANREPQRWGLLPSSFGWHAVRVDAIREGGSGSDDMLRARARQDWIDHERGRAAREAIDSLRGLYQIEGLGKSP